MKRDGHAKVVYQVKRGSLVLTFLSLGTLGSQVRSQVCSVYGGRQSQWSRRQSQEEGNSGNTLGCRICVSQGKGGLTLGNINTPALERDPRGTICSSPLFVDLRSIHSLMALSKDHFCDAALLQLLPLTGTLQLHGISQPHGMGLKKAFPTGSVGAQSSLSACANVGQLIAFAPC